MRFRILGPLEVDDGGAPVPLGGPKRRALLALLLLHADEVVPTQRLVDELWGEKAPASAGTALHNHISRLRKVLGDNLLVTRPRGYMLRLDGHEFDLDQFERLVSEASDAEASARAAKLREALGLWRGPALADVELPFVQGETARLDELRLAALEERIEADLALARHAELVPELEALAREHPLRERLRGQLILALYRCGRQAEALETYREGRRYLADELGLEPSPELRELERLILLQDPALSAPGREEAEVAERTDRRSRTVPLVALVALAGLAAAGAALALVLTTGQGSKDIAPARAAVPPRHTIVRHRPNVTPSTVHASHRVAHKQTAHARPKRVQHAIPVKPKPTVATPPTPTRTVVLVEKLQPPATTVKIASEPKATTPSREPPPPPPPPPPAKTVQATAPQPKIVTVSDNFPGTLVAPTIWYTACCQGMGVTASETGGHLQFDFAPDTAPGGQYNIAGGHFGTQCRFPGDFDARVDFTLPEWPYANGVVASLWAWLGPQNIGAQVNRISNEWGEQYGAWLDPAHPISSPVPDKSGSLRLARKNGVLSAYFLYQGQWIKLASLVNRLPAAIALGATTGSGTGTTFAGHEVIVDFENFRVTAVAPDCPPGS